MADRDVIRRRAGSGLAGRAVYVSRRLTCQPSLTVARDCDGQGVSVVGSAVMRQRRLRQVKEGETNGCKRHQDRREHCPDPPGAERPENCSQWTGQHILSKSGIRRPGYGRSQLDPCRAKGRGDSSTGEYNCRIAAWSMTLLTWHWPECIVVPADTVFIYITYDRLHRPQPGRMRIRQLTAGRTAAPPDSGPLAEP